MKRSWIRLIGNRPDFALIFGEPQVGRFVREAAEGRLDEEGGHMSGVVERTTLDTAQFRSACTFGECVEVAMTEVVAVRDSKNAPDGPVLWFSHAEWDEFVAAVKAGKFDLG